MSRYLSDDKNEDIKESQIFILPNGEQETHFEKAIRISKENNKPIKKNKWKIGLILSKTIDFFGITISKKF